MRESRHAWGRAMDLSDPSLAAWEVEVTLTQEQVYDLERGGHLSRYDLVPEPFEFARAVGFEEEPRRVEWEWDPVRLEHRIRVFTDEVAKPAFMGVTLPYTARRIADGAHQSP